jgi:hypothetical protein
VETNHPQLLKPQIVLPRIEKLNEIYDTPGKKKGLVFSFILPRVSGDKVWHVKINKIRGMNIL